MVVCVRQSSFHKLLRMFKGNLNNDVFTRFPVVETLNKFSNDVTSLRLDGTRNGWNVSVLE